MLTLQQGARLIADKKDFYNAMNLNGWHMPKLKTPLVTREFMNGVRYGQVYCPKKRAVKLAYCPDPPA